jgi:hypothetical protein
MREKQQNDPDWKEEENTYIENKRIWEEEEERKAQEKGEEVEMMGIN